MPIENNMQWTPERVNKLTAMWSAGMTGTQIAAAFDGLITRCSVIGKARRLGLSKRPRNPNPDPRRTRPKRTRPFRVPRITAPSIKPEVETMVDDDGSVGPGCSLFHLVATTCRWPLGTPGDEAFCFCGADCAPEVAYCRFHMQTAYNRSAPTGRPWVDYSQRRRA